MRTLELTTNDFFYGVQSTALMSNLLTTAVRSVPEVTGADGAFLWTENTGGRRFGFCYKEAQIFSGVHSGFQTVIDCCVRSALSNDTILGRFDVQR